MTITYIGATKNDINGTAATSVTTNSATVNVNAGDLVFVFVKHEGAATTRTISDSAGNSWTGTSLAAVDHTNNDMHVEMFAKVIGTGASGYTVTCTVGAARAYFFVGAVVYRSDVGWTYFDTASAQGTSAAPSAGSKTPTGAYAAVTGIGEYAAVTWTAGTNWTSTLTGTFATTFVERRTNTTGETITGNATPNTSMDWAAVMGVYLESGGGGGGTFANDFRLLKQNRPGSGPYSTSSYFRPKLAAFTALPEFLHTASGGLTFGGAATATEANDYTASSSGGIVFAGAATALESNDYTQTSSGGIQFGGAATTSFDAGFTATGSGGLTFSGTATAVESNDYSATGAGGLSFAGAASADFTRAYDVTSSGGIQFGGTAAAQVDSGFSATGSGGIVFAGTATAIEANDYTQTGSGGVTFGGTASTEYSIAGSGQGGQDGAGRRGVPMRKWRYNVPEEVEPIPAEPAPAIVTAPEPGAVDAPPPRRTAGQLLERVRELAQQRAKLAERMQADAVRAQAELQRRAAELQQAEQRAASLIQAAVDAEQRSIAEDDLAAASRAAALLFDL